jgi:hypothetical protein
MSNTQKQPDSDAIDASISVLGEDGGEPKVASIDRSASHETSASVESVRADSAGAQENLEAPIHESEEAARSTDGGSVERPGSDPDLV